jgi:hypothetical protein
MRVIALILGILGGVVGVIFAYFPLVGGGVGNAPGALSDDQIRALAASAMVAAVCGIVWSLLAFAGKRPALMALLLTITAVGYVVSVWYLGVAGLIFFALAALFVFLGRKTRRRAIQAG